MAPHYPQLSEAQQNAVQAILGGTPIDKAAKDAAAKMSDVLRQQQ